VPSRLNLYTPSARRAETRHTHLSVPPTPFLSSQQHLPPLYPLNRRRTFPVPNGAPVDLINISIKLSEIGFFAITPEPCACIYILYIYLLYANEMQDEMRWSYI